MQLLQFLIKKLIIHKKFKNNSNNLNPISFKLTLKKLN
jgi:hypothetical protein